MLYKLVGLILAANLHIAASYQSYDGFQVWRLTPTKKDVGHLREWISSNDLDVWHSAPDHVDVMVSPEQIVQFRHQLIEHRVIIENVDKLIQDPNKKVKTNRDIPTTLHHDTITLDEYHTYAEISDYIYALAEHNPLVTVNVIGTSYENRSINIVSISTDPSANKNLVWIDCGIHAREWISPASCVYGIDYLSENYGNDSKVTQFLDENDVYIVPTLNPDGYDFTFTDTRLWRKNRSPQNNDCFGVDLNRNFDGGNWGGEGSSNMACSLLYHGPSAFSEAETQAVRDTITGLDALNGIKAYFSIHSYGQLWMYVFGYKQDLAPESPELERVSQAGVDAIFSVNGMNYVNGPHFDTIYQASGVSCDWGYSVGIKHSYIVELRDQGEYGFLLPEDQILQTSEELWEGLLAAVNEI